MSAIDRSHDYAADVRAAFERLLAETRAENERLRSQLAAAMMRIGELKEQLAECDGSAREDAEHDARNAQTEASELPGRRGYEVLP